MRRASRAKRPIPRTDSAPLRDAQRRSRKRREFEREALVHLDALYSFALRLAGGNGAVAEDLVQEAVLRAYRSWRQYELGTNCRAWLMTILRNAFLSWRHSEGLMPTTATDRLESPGHRLPRALRSADPERDYFAAIIDDRLIEAIDALPLHYREAVVLSDVHGLAYAEISKVLGVAIGTVKSRLFRGRRALQDELCELAIELGYRATAA
jgi:RNA polymerase sigma-70 factor (ECF subfamily)